MKTFHVCWKLNTSVVTVEVITMTGREDSMVEKTAMRNLKRDGIFIDGTRLEKPTITLVYSGESTAKTFIGQIN